MGTFTTTQPSLPALRIHVETLLAEHLVSADYHPEVSPTADPAERHVVIPPVRDGVTYAAALAQIARVVVGHEPAAELWLREQSLLARGEMRVMALV
jgi:hypothetical protein